MRNGLTQRQETFCLKYFETGNAGEAALVAGYSPKTAPVIASQNLTKLKIINRLDELRKKMEVASVANKLEREQILTEIARGRIGTLLDENHRIKEDVPLDDASIQEINTFEVTIGKGENAKLAEVTKIKLHNPIQAIDLLNKMDKIYTDQPQVTIDNRQINFIIRSQDEANEVKDLLAGISERLDGH